MADDALDGGVGVAADQDRQVRLLHRLGTQVGRIEVDEASVVLSGFVGPQRFDGLDALVEEGAAGLRFGAVVAQFFDVPAGAHAEHEPSPEIRSMLAASLAVMIGSRWISNAMPVINSMRDVTAAAAASVTKGSSVR